MKLFHVASAASLFTVGLLVAPQSAFALSTVSTPIFSSSTLTNVASDISFKGFNSANFSLPPGSFLTNVQLTLKGTTGGTVTATNYSPSVNSFQNNDFKIFSNGSSNGQPNNYANVIIPAVTIPSFPNPPIPVPGVATSTITPTDRTFQFNIWNPTITGASPGNTAAFFSGTSVTIPAFSQANPGFTPGGPYVSADGSTFIIDTTLANSYLTYTYDVPGPVPILGAGAFFGWSRRMRRRISKSA
jgi:hypothetical protein